HVPLVRGDEIFVDPAVGLGSVVLPVEVVLRAPQVFHARQAPTLDTGNIGMILEFLGEPGLEKMRWFDDVIINTDDVR
ncbi:MAG: hypothetical protein ACKVIY_16840, partial [Acidimicrobiales bacterium]